jgi:CBS-domain-containing membrane protein
MEALQQIQQHGVDCLPVVQGRDEIVGIVSRTDLMTAFDVIDSAGPPVTLTDRTAGQV